MSLPTENFKSMRSAVLSKISRGEVIMRSRLSLMVRVILLITVAVAILILSLLITSFLLFSIHEGGELLLLGFGVRGIVLFFQLFPWMLFVLDIALILFMQWLIHGFQFAYRVPLLHLFGIVLVISVSLSVVIAITPLHHTLLKHSLSGQLPIVGTLYQRIYDADESYGEFKGRVLSIRGRNVTISHNDYDRDEDDGTLVVIAAEGADLSDIAQGDWVYVAGDLQGTTITAYGVRKLPPPPSFGR